MAICNVNVPVQRLYLNIYKEEIQTHFALKEQNPVFMISQTT